MDDGWEGVGESGFVLRDRKGFQKGGDVWVRDKGLGVGDTLIVEDYTGAEGVRRPGFGGTWRRFVSACRIRE